jgi:hypothetical protein
LSRTRSPVNIAAVPAPIAPPLSPEEKLELLRDFDQFRFWWSLDDERVCDRCQRTITGHRIVALARVGTDGEMILHCPTAGCRSTPGEWVYADPLLAASRRSESPPPRRRVLSDAAIPLTESPSSRF